MQGLCKASSIARSFLYFPNHQGGVLLFRPPEKKGLRAFLRRSSYPEPSCFNNYNRKDDICYLGGKPGDPHRPGLTLKELLESYYLQYKRDDASLVGLGNEIIEAGYSGHAGILIGILLYRNRDGIYSLHMGVDRGVDIRPSRGNKVEVLDLVTCGKSLLGRRMGEKFLSSVQ